MDGICSRYEKADKMTYPRLGAMCETVWHGENSYEQFHNKLDYYYSYLDKNRIGYSKLYFANPNRALGFYRGFGLKNDSSHGKDYQIFLTI